MSAAVSSYWRILEKTWIRHDTIFTDRHHENQTTDLRNQLGHEVSKKSAYRRDSKFLFRLPVLYLHPHTPQESSSIFKIEILFGGERFLGGAGFAFRDCMLNFSTCCVLVDFLNPSKKIHGNLELDLESRSSSRFPWIFLIAFHGATVGALMDALLMV